MLAENRETEFSAEGLVDEDDWQLYEENEEDACMVSEAGLFEEEEIDIPRLKQEIETIERFIDKAKHIKEDSKAEALLTALEQSFAKLHDMGANRKALIFTESTKTQSYLREFLEANGYDGKVVLFNGKASEPQTNDIYKRWCAEHADKVSGIKAADRRAAIVDYFQNDAEIMIATEAAAEGLNLQFCSLLINFDLPWNPQRIEQRIGRCHRYGQKFDVVVVNFINTRNYADVRVFELLSDKFKLFDDVFGASDEVLGKADNIDIENRIWEIYQQCRSEEEINSAFERLQADMQKEIDQRMDEVRAEVMEHFDINVQEHLRTCKDETGAFLNRYQHIFWELTKFVLSSQAVFDDNSHSFVLKVPVTGMRKGKYSLLNTGSDSLPYRLNDPLAQHVINTALSLPMEDGAVVEIDEEAISMNASLPDYLHGESGWMILSTLKVSSFEEEQYSLFTTFTDSGRPISQDDAERLMLNGGTETGAVEIPSSVKEELQKNVAQRSKAKLNDIDSRNLNYYNQEAARIEMWEHDCINALETELGIVKRSILQAEREARTATSVQEKIEQEKKVDELKRKKRRLRNELEDREDEISEQRRKMIAELEQKMIQSTESQNLFFIRWTTK